ncbi:MAG TPA: DNRLRE domain-containing protein [Kofleriaceae bacterium]
MKLHKQTLQAGAALALVGTLAGASISSADITDNAPALHDAMIFGTSAGADTGNASGMGPGMFAGADGMSNRKRSLVTFDLSGVPANATVVSATMHLVLGQIAGSGGGSSPGTYPDRTLSVWHMTRTWSEGTSGSPTSTSIGGSGQGYTRVTGDSSWSYANYSSVLWTTAGGDHASTALAAITFHQPFSNGQILSWGTTAMRDEVRNWLTTPSGYHGWEITSNLEASPTSFLGFWTKDGASANHNTALAPVLEIHYTTP